MSVASVSVPLRVRVEIAHAAVQRIAEVNAVDVLHIKGPALAPSIVWEGREGTDADILVRPADVPTLLSALEQAGWQILGRFETSSPFEHSATLWHQLWGYVDVHRLFPGITAPPSIAFQRLWDDRDTRAIAAIQCPVPSIKAQILVLVLHAARAGGSSRGMADVEASWGSAAPDERRRVLDLVEELGADVAFAAGIGDLERFKGSREHDLWQIASQGGTRAQEWRARIRAAPNAGAALRLALRAPLVNTDHLAMLLHRRPTRREVVVEFFARPFRGLVEEFRARDIRSPRRGRGG